MFIDVFNEFYFCFPSLFYQRYCHLVVLIRSILDMHRMSNKCFYKNICQLQWFEKEKGPIWKSVVNIVCELGGIHWCWMLKVPTLPWSFYMLDLIVVLLHRKSVKKEKRCVCSSYQNVQRMFPPEKALKRKLIWNHVTATLEAGAGNASWHIDEKNSFNALSWMLRHCHRIRIFFRFVTRTSKKAVIIPKHIHHGGHDRNWQD